VDSAHWVVLGLGVLVILTGGGTAIAWTVALDRAGEARRFAGLAFLRSATTIGGGVIVLLGLSDANRVIVVIVGALVVASWVLQAWLRRRWTPAGFASGRANARDD
jgi:hypothetical protein